MLKTVYRAVWPSGQTVTWRPLTWNEYHLISSLPSEYGRCAAVYRATRLDGPPPHEALAGIVQWVGRHQLETNPFSGQLAPIQKQRAKSKAWVESYLNSAAALVSWAFGYKFEEIEEWDQETFFNRLAQAEYIFGKPLDPVDPKAPKEEPGKKKGSGMRLRRPSPSQPRQ